MAVFDNSIYFPNLVGSIGGLTIQQNRAGNIIRLKPHNGNFRTVKQSEEIKLFSQLSQQWRALTITEQNDWNTFSLANPHVNLWNQTKNLTGLNYFILCNYYLSTSGLSQITSPPTYTVPTLAASVEVTISTSAITVDLITPSLNNGDIIMIYLTAPLSGKTSLPSKELRFMKYIVYAGVNSFDVTTEWENFFNLPITATLYDPANSIFVAASVFDPSSGIPTPFLSAISTTGAAYTARTLAFLAATGISDTTIANALNAMDLSLISTGLDAYIDALYPYVGGTATTHKYNFMNAADTNGAYRINFAGIITHDANGITGNGSNGVGETYWPLNLANLYDRSWSCYLRTSGSENKWTGRYDGIQCFGLQLNSTGASKVIQAQGLNTLGGSGSIYNWGLIGISVPSSGANASFVFNILSVIFNITAGASPTTGTMPTLGMPDIGQYTTRNLAFEHYGKGLSSAQFTQLSNIVTTFETALGRNV